MAFYIEQGDYKSVLRLCSPGHREHLSAKNFTQRAYATTAKLG